MKNVTRAVFAILFAMVVSVTCQAQRVAQFNPRALDPIEPPDAVLTDGTASEPAVVEISRVEDNYLVRNTLVLAALGLIFTLGMIVTAVTIRQNRPTVPTRANFFAS